MKKYQINGNNTKQNGFTVETGKKKADFMGPPFVLYSQRIILGLRRALELLGLQQQLQNQLPQ